MANSLLNIVYQHHKLISSAAVMAQILHTGDSIYSLLSKCFFVNYLINRNRFCSDPLSFHLKHEQCIHRFTTNY